MSKEKGLICTTNSVNAIREGRKTQTRRVIKVQPPSGHHQLQFNDTQTEAVWGVLHVPDLTIVNSSERFAVPHAVGDRIYVKEAVCESKGRDTETGEFYHKNWYYKADMISEPIHDGLMICGTATAVAKINTYADLYKWRSPMMMPKAAARIWLEVTAIRVEHVRDISEADAIAEGFTSSPDKFPAREQFGAAWCAMHSLKSWNNDWVWVIEFKVTEGAK